MCGLLGDLPFTGDSFEVDKENVAIATQEPWIFKGTIKDNIVFGGQPNIVIDDERYR